MSIKILIHDLPPLKISHTRSKLLRLGLGLLLVAGIVFSKSSLSSAQDPSSEWSQPIDITQPSTSTGGEFGTLLCDHYQNTHIFWSNMTDKDSAIYYRNDINGDWSDPVDVVATTDKDVVRLQSVVSDQSDIIHLIWVNGWIGGDLYYSRASLVNASDPKAWSPPQLLAYDTPVGSIGIDSSGVIHVMYGTPDLQGDGRELRVEYIKSIDDGVTWSEPVTAFSTSVPVPSRMWSRIAVDDADRIHVGITLDSQQYGEYSEMGYVQSIDGGETWSAFTNVGGSGTAFQGVSTLTPYAFGEDEIHLTWHDPRRMHQWSLDGGNTWSNPIEIMTLAAAFGGPNALTKDSAGTVHVVTAVRGGVFSASWNGAQWSPPKQIDFRDNDPHGQDIVSCQGNQVYIVYDDRNDEGKVWFANLQVDAPHVERIPLPTPSPTSLPLPTPTTSVVLNPTPKLLGTVERVTLNQVESTSPSPIHSLASSNPIMPIVISVMIVCATIVVVFVFNRL